MQIYKLLIQEIKQKIDLDDFEGCKEFYNNLNFDEYIPWDYVFQKVYLHACLKKKLNFKVWFESLFSQFNPMQQIAIRQTFNYGNYLFSK